MSKNKKKEVYAMLYKRILLSSDYIVFIPCNISKGIYDPSDRSFIDESKFPYYECDNYDIVTSNEDLTYLYDITEKDLNDIYKTTDISKALEKYSKAIKELILIGHINSKDKIIEISKISYNMLKSLSSNFIYKDLDGEGTVTLTKMQLRELISRDDLESLKKELIEHIKKISVYEKSKEKASCIDRIEANSIGNKTYIEMPSTNHVVKPQEQSYIVEKNIKNQENSSTYSFKDLYDYILESLVGQDESVRDLLAIILDNLTSTRKEEITRPLLIGPTGSGKTFFFELLGKKLDIPVIIIDCNLIVQSGYEGQSIENVLTQIYLECDRDTEKMKRCIVIFDEIDKLAARGSQVSDEGVQKALLKFIDGHKYIIDVDKVGFEKVTIDTTFMNIVAAGAFEGLFEKNENKVGFNSIKQINNDRKINTDKLVKYGMLPELIGRFTYKVQYNDLTLQMIEQTLLTSKASPLLINQEKFLNKYKCTINFSKEYIKRLCKSAIENKTGFRGIKTAVNESLVKILFKLQCEQLGETAVFIDDKIIDNPNDFQIIKKLKR